MKPRLLHNLRHLACSAACLIALICPHIASGQNDPLYTQAWALPTLYNPAAAGSTDWLRIRGAARMQWIGIKNAPKSFTAAADIPFRVIGRRWGGGLNVTREGIGLFSNTFFNAQLSGRLWKVLGGELTFGLQVGYFGSSFKGSEVYIPDDDDYHEPYDPSIPDKDVGGGTIDFGIGMEFVHPKFHAGVSLIHPGAPKVKLTTKDSSSSASGSGNHEFETYVSRVLYLTAGGNIPVKNTLIELQPDLIAALDNQTLSGVVSLKAWYNKMFFGGMAYRWKDAVSVNIGAEFKNIILGYAYDIPVSRILKVSSGSHEIVVGYRMKLDFGGRNLHRHRSIRLM